MSPCTYLILHAVNISCNEHDDGHDLILITNGQILFDGSVFLKHNKYYENIINLQSSLLVLMDYVKISRNYARYNYYKSTEQFIPFHAYFYYNH